MAALQSLVRSSAGASEDRCDHEHSGGERCSGIGSAEAGAGQPVVLPHAYRSAEVQEVCVVCEEQAFARCPGCNRAYCHGHAAMNGPCADCELALSQRAWKVGSPITAAYVLAGVAAVVWVALHDEITALGLATAVGITALLLGALIGKVVRRKASRGWMPVENAALAIGPAVDAERPARRMLSGSGPNDKYDMYGAARRAGFGRVQGCA